MKLTPLDIQQQKFRLAFRGFDAQEVDAFLELVAGDFESLIRENEALKDEIVNLKATIEEYKAKEKTIYDAMMSAEKAADGVKTAARKEAELIVAKAKLDAEKTGQEDEARLAKTRERIHELRQKRNEFESSLRSFIESHLRLLESGRETIPDIETPEDASGEPPSD